MNEAKYTPGPWTHTRGSGVSFCDWTVEPNENRAIVPVIAHIVTMYDDAEGNEEANARLIASAPELFEALKHIQPDVCSWLCPSVKDTGSEWTHVEKCERVRTAITKAEGQQ